MNILYSSSDSYASLTGISLLSLLENNQQFDKIHVYIMDNKISIHNKKKLENITKIYKREISFIPMPDIEKMTGQNINIKRWNISTFGRLYMASSLPDSVHKVLNIDSDTIVIDSLELLWNIDLTGKVFGGMLECINDRYRRNIGIENGAPYLNGGIIFMNCDEVRNNRYEQKFTDYIQLYGGSLAYLDQDVINSVVPANKKVILPLRYNLLSIYFYASYKEILKIRRSNTFYSCKEFEVSIKNPALIHYTTCFLDDLRPWFTKNNHPYRKQFLIYKKMSPWRDEPLWKDHRNIFLKLRTFLIKKTPKFLIYEIASVLHGVIIPNKNLRQMKSMLKE